MRRIRFAAACLTVLLSSCNGALKETSPENGQGIVSISLTSASDNNVTKADEDINSHLGDFTLEITNSSGVCFYREKFADAADTEILMNSGDYTLTAKYGNPTNAGFENAMFYKAEQQFTVHPQTHETISAVATLAKVKVAVKYVNLLELDENDYFVNIEWGTAGDIVKFSKEETRAAYIPAGKLIPVFHYCMNGEWKSFRAKSLIGNPNDFITFKIDLDPTVNPDEGSASISVTIDTETETIEKPLEIEYIEFTGQGPTFDIISDSPGNTELRVYPGERAASHKARVDALVPDRVEKCLLQIESPYLSSLGIPSEVDLTDMESQACDLLWEYGIRWFREMKGRRLTFVDLEGYADHIANMHYDPDNPKNANFKIIVEDMNKQREETSFARFIEVKPEFTLDAVVANIYATKSCEITATLQRGTGNPAALLLDYRSDSDPAFSDWRRAEMRHDLILDTETENINAYADMSGLKPNTKYRMRLRYRNNDKLVKYFDFTTEEAAQVGNAGFEEWSTDNLVKNTRYYPYLSDAQDKWWDSNNRQTALSNPSLYPNYKCFPTVWYTEGHNGDKAAQITAVAVNNANSEIMGAGATQGELFIGTYGGNRKHNFTSRPSAVKFWYKYAPEGNDTWQALVQIMNGSTVIGEGRLTNSAQVSSWAEGTVNIPYSNTKLKATGIYIQFLQSTSSSPRTRKKTVTTPEGDFQIYGGSQLTVDDVELIY